MRTNVLLENEFQDATQHGQFPNTAGVNLPNVDEISIGDLNRSVLQPIPNTNLGTQTGEGEPLFGAHLREAATTVRKLFGA